MSNIRSFGDFDDAATHQPYSFAGGHNSAIGVEEGHTVHLYSDGFTVDGGPFRSLNHPENALFLSAVRDGVAPPELHTEGQDVRVYLIDDSHRKYMMKTSESNLQSTSLSKSAGVSNVEHISMESTSSETVTIRIKLYDNRQIHLKVGNNTSIGELRSLIADKSGLPTSSFHILSGFPPTNMKWNDFETVSDHDLSGSTIIQRVIT
ncbi:SEP domain family protein [Babesia bovis T2Bo]|uniref:ubiquitinyl hydrolase 1 n=1 Tax=Babesia bovis TaxID=5865 RepID=A7ARH0_BABBO|nr:SEP domain family protein [Babesia bovis T2Bo]EDO07139.1 SEP domain family protein [Babesia bovis T2Bo]|eukprot:XP_001610707.1 hypothetical protein [Babesia bovis T2Bo]